MKLVKDESQMRFIDGNSASDFASQYIRLKIIIYFTKLIQKGEIFIHYPWVDIL